MVLYCINNNKFIDQLTIEEFKQFSENIEKDVYIEISLEKCVSERKIPGGPSKEAVNNTIKNCQSYLNSI